VSRIHNIRLIIVEDDPVQAQILQDKLVELNDKFSITTFKSGEELIADYEKNGYHSKHHYVILDYFLQTNENTEALNGLAVIKIMGQKFPKVNIILFSAYDNDENSDFKLIKEEPNVIDFIKKSEHAFSSLQNSIRFHYSQTILVQKKKRFQWAFVLFILMLILSSLHFLFSFIS